MSKKNILLIVEGYKSEKGLFDRLLELYSINYDIYCYNTNIYSLYNKMKNNDFYVNIKDLLKENNSSQSEILDKDFLYTYLIFDFDVQHTNRCDDRPKEKIIMDNIEIIDEMINYFDDETDPTVGKLYINYPMFESFKDSNFYMDEEYKNEVCKITNIENYKQSVNKKKLSRLHLDKIKKEEFEKLLLQNIYKAKYISDNIWDKPLYDDYIKIASNHYVFEREKGAVINNKEILVINTSLFLISDYFGNKNKFYDNLK